MPAIASFPSLPARSFCLVLGWALGFVCVPLGQTLAETPGPPLPADCVFYVSFDRSANADRADGDQRIYTSRTLKREHVRPGLQTSAVKWQKEGGRRGGALRFDKSTPELVFFRGGKNVPCPAEKFNGTISLWMKCDPQNGLPKGYVDPLQVTDKKWDNASIYIDFEPSAARDFRLGAFSDFKFWNPENRKFDAIPEPERPLVIAQQASFSADRWTHVAVRWENFNVAKTEATTTLFVDGRVSCKIVRPQRFTWDESKSVIMLGINYVGWLDELAVFDRPLSEKEIKQLAGEAK